MGEPLRWGIAGTGDIARQFASDLRHVEGAELIAVGSRKQETADRFGDTHQIPHRHASYLSLAEYPRVDVVYVASPHPQHCAHTLLFLDHGKHVLCEKPLAMNAAESLSMVEAARARGLFLMEALWTYCFPAVRKLAALLEDGALGEVRLMEASFCYQAVHDPASRLFNRTLGGGALLDLGVYPLALTQLVFPEPPVTLRAQGRLGVTGVDEDLALVTTYANGALAVSSSSLRIHLPQRAVIGGLDGYVTMPHFSQPDALTLHRPGYEETWRYQRAGFGYSFEAAEVVRCLREGARESPLAPLENSLARARLLDEAGRQLGLGHAAEEPGLPPA